MNQFAPAIGSIASLAYVRQEGEIGRLSEPDGGIDLRWP
jgi:hypothetical protein